MKRNLILTLVASLILVVVASGCRSRKKTQPVTTPAPVVQAPAPAPVEPRDNDFVAAEPDREVLPSDLSELTALAHQRGWLRDAFFSFDASTLDSQAREALSASARWLRDNPQYRILIEGHCDERGTSQYNLALGERRAQAARDYLVQSGVAAHRIRITSLGEERPFDTASHESAWARNRRAHLLLVSE